MEGPITVTLLVQDNRIACLETTQEGESQSRGGYEAIRDGRFAAMIEAAQVPTSTRRAALPSRRRALGQAVEDGRYGAAGVTQDEEGSDDGAGT